MEPRHAPSLVACFGNVLRGDDGFGVAVADRLALRPLPAGVRLHEVGIGGINLVQDLLHGVDRLVVVDAVDIGRPPGTVVVVRPEIEEIADLSAFHQRDRLAETHYATPERALRFARALGVLPADTWLVGCQVTDPDAIGQGLSDVVTAALNPAVDEILALVSGVVPR